MSCLFSVFAVQAQVENVQIIEELMESLSEDLGEDFDYAELAERLQHYQAHPIDLNKTNTDELLALRFLSPFQAEQIISHREISGNFVSIYELQAVEGLDLNSIRFLTPFVQVSSSNQLEVKNLKQLVKKGKQELMFRYGRVLEQQRGYAIADSGRSRYLGSPDRLFLRYRYRYGQKLKLAINMKKDAGEQFFSGAQTYGFDFYSASMEITDQHHWKRIIIGDYSLQFGQGLGLWTGLSFGKGAFIQNIARQGVGLRQYTSANEFSFFRGVAASYERKAFSFTPFVSYKRLTATLQDDTLNQYSAISQSGLHRTPSEVLHKDKLGELLYGVNLAYRKPRFHIGLTAYQYRLSGEFVPRSLLYNQFSFQGQSLDNISAYYHYSLKNVYAFGEIAHNIDRGFAFLNGLVFPVSSQWSVALLYRNYQKTYDTFYSQAFAEGSTVTNENGFYSGLIFQPNRRLQWVAYVDYFRFPWLKYRVDAPSSGYDLFTQLSFVPNKRLNFTARYRYRKKEENGTVDVVNLLVPFTRQQARLSMQYALTDWLNLRSRFEYGRYRKEEQNESAYLFYQDFIGKPTKSKWSGNLRLAFFRTGGYNSRIYAFEQDVLYAYSFPFYSENGWRYYLNLRYTLAKGIDLWGRYAAFFYTNQDQVGSALDLIEGHQKSEVKLQVRFQF